MIRENSTTRNIFVTATEIIRLDIQLCLTLEHLGMAYSAVFLSKVILLETCVYLLSLFNFFYY